jgi:hypothetical protein
MDRDADTFKQGDEMNRCLAPFAALWCLILAVVPLHAVADTVPAAQPYTATLHGRVVKYGLSGFEPDFDPINRVIISAVLHDWHAGRITLPDTPLILSLYLENFRPDTTPVLPDLLHPKRTATGLGGFMQGKAALVTGAHHVGYRGSLVAEVFLDNSVHLIMDLDRQGAPDSAPALRLMGTFMLHKDLSLAGILHTTRGLTPPVCLPDYPARRASAYASGPGGLAGLSVRHGPALRASWLSARTACSLSAAPLLTHGPACGVPARPAPL